MIRRRVDSRSIENAVVIARVANGWIVSMPKSYESPPDDFATGMASSMEALKPMFQDLLKMRDEDPLLAKLRERQLEEDEEEEEKAPQRPIPAPVIGQDPFVLVCPTFQDVLNILSDHFLYLD
jgi:hypothetical protein